MAKTNKTVKSALKTLLKNTTAKAKKVSESEKGYKADAAKEVSCSACGNVNTQTCEAESADAKKVKALCIDYPASNDVVYCGHYSFRIGANGKKVGWVKVSVNGGSWQDCRTSNGYWWYDWWNFGTGTFFAEALALVDGKEVRTPKRKFKVSL